MQFTVQRRLAASVFGCSPDKIWFDASQLEKIKEAITRADIRSLINNGTIRRKVDHSNSRGRARARHAQKRKGRQRGVGSRKGKKTARLGRKDAWIDRVRLQREFLQSLRAGGYFDNKIFRDMYQKIKGGFFRSRRHLKLYLEENKLVTASQKRAPVSKTYPLKKEMSKETKTN